MKPPWRDCFNPLWSVGRGVAASASSLTPAKTATQALQALFSQIDDQEGDADITATDSTAAGNNMAADRGGSAVSTPTALLTPHPQVR